MNVVVWARVSSREQREGYSLDAQLRANRQRAESNCWPIVREFVVAESAKRGAERKAFNEMLTWLRANAKREKIKAILSHKLDRVCRNMRDAVRLQELEDLCGIQLVFVENQFGPGAAGALSFNVMAAVAQYYSDNLRSEVLKGMDEKVRQGWPTGLAPFGYINTDDPDEPIKPHPKRLRSMWESAGRPNRGWLRRKMCPSCPCAGSARSVRPGMHQKSLDQSAVCTGPQRFVRSVAARLVTTKRKPFDVLAEGLDLKNSRGERN
jgi:DNA invertase Pin-like site-specific DNA recombinase